MTSHNAIALVAVLAAMSPGATAQEYDDELMLGTWTATGISETECHFSDASVTLRIFEALEPGHYRATYVERGIVTLKDECDDGEQVDEDAIVPVEIGGGVVYLDIEGSVVTIWSRNPNFHPETLELQGSTMIGKDDMGGIEYVKSYPEFRYDAKEGSVGWQAISYPLSEAEQVTMGVISECSFTSSFAESFKKMIESAVREAIKSGGKESTIKRSGRFDHLVRFDGMTPGEIFDSALPEVSTYLTSEIADARKALHECEECPDERLEELRDELATRKSQRDAILSIKRQGD